MQSSTATTGRQNTSALGRRRRRPRTSPLLKTRRLLTGHPKTQSMCIFYTADQLTIRPARGFVDDNVDPLRCGGPTGRASKKPAPASNKKKNRQTARLSRVARMIGSELEQRWWGITSFFFFLSLWPHGRTCIFLASTGTGVAPAIIAIWIEKSCGCPLPGSA